MCGDCCGCSESRKALPKLTSAFLVLTESCNLKCRYCWVKQQPRHMTLEVARRAIDFLIKNAEEQGVQPNITFFGGEPLLRWDDIIVPIVEYIRKDYAKPFSLGITSNCVLLTEDKMKYMKENDMTLLFSIDGNKETQDYNRPFHGEKGSFDVLKDTIQLIPKYFPTTTFRSTVIPETVHHLFNNYKFALDSGYTHMFATPNVFIEWGDEEKKILEGELRRICDYIIEGLRNNKPVNFANLDEVIIDCVKINRIIYGKEKKPVSKCGLGQGMGCSISPTGVVLGCQEMSSYDDDTFIIGDIFNGVSDEKRYALIDKFQKRNIEGLNCDTCKYRPICNGGCVANNYLVNKDLNKVPHMSCYWNQLMLSEALRIIAVMGHEKNECFKRRYFSSWSD